MTNNNINDVEYFSNIINVIVDKYNGDINNIFIVGWLNGGSMGFRLLCELSENITGAAIFSGYL